MSGTELVRHFFNDVPMDDEQAELDRRVTKIMEREYIPHLDPDTDIKLRDAQTRLYRIEVGEQLEREKEAREKARKRSDANKQLVKSAAISTARGIGTGAKMLGKGLWGSAGWMLNKLRSNKPITIDVEPPAMGAYPEDMLSEDIGVHPRVQMLPQSQPLRIEMQQQPISAPSLANILRPQTIPMALPAPERPLRIDREIDPFEVGAITEDIVVDPAVIPRDQWQIERPAAIPIGPEDDSPNQRTLNTERAISTVERKPFVTREGQVEIQYPKPQFPTREGQVEVQYPVNIFSQSTVDDVFRKIQQSVPRTIPISIDDLQDRAKRLQEDEQLAAAIQDIAMEPKTQQNQMIQQQQQQQQKRRPTPPRKPDPARPQPPSVPPPSRTDTYAYDLDLSTMDPLGMHDQPIAPIPSMPPPPASFANQPIDTELDIQAAMQGASGGPEADPGDGGDPAQSVMEDGTTVINRNRRVPQLTQEQRLGLLNDQETYGAGYPLGKAPGQETMEAMLRRVMLQQQQPQQFSMVGGSSSSETGPVNVSVKPRITVSPKTKSGAKSRSATKSKSKKRKTRKTKKTKKSRISRSIVSKNKSKNISKNKKKSVRANKLSKAKKTSKSK